MNAHSGFTIVNLIYSVKTLRVFLPANVRKASLGMVLIVKTSMRVSLTCTPAVRMHFAWTVQVNSLAYVVVGTQDPDISAKLSVRQYSVLFVSSFSKNILLESRMPWQFADTRTHAHTHPSPPPTHTQTHTHTPTNTHTHTNTHTLTHTHTHSHTLTHSHTHIKTELYWYMQMQRNITGQASKQHKDPT